MIGSTRNYGDGERHSHAVLSIYSFIEIGSKVYPGQSPIMRKCRDDGKVALRHI